MTLSLSIWDVQHGSAAYIRTPNGKHIVVDLGVGSTRAGTPSFSPLRHLYYNYGVHQLDEVIITHPHRDHLDDILNFALLNPKVLKRPKHLSEDEIRTGNQLGDRSIIDRYMEIDRYYSEPVDPAGNPESSAVNGGVEITTFIPVAAARSNLNNHSIVTFIRYAGSTICLPGDNEAPSWRELLESPLFCRYMADTNVFVAAHHGREAGYCSDIFGANLCSPVLVLVSDGPGCDTSAVSKYCGHARGWPVLSRSRRNSRERQVLTTRSDGVLVVECSSSGAQNYLSVSAE